jgi:hypothetical protein
MRSTAAAQREQLIQGAGERRRVARRHLAVAPVGHQLGQPAGVRGRDRQAAGERLEGAHPERLAQRGQRQQRAGAQQRRDLGAANAPEQRHPAGQRLARRPGADLGLERPGAGEAQLGLGMRARDGLEGLEQRVDALAALQAAQEQHARPLRPLAGPSGMEGLQVDPRRHDQDPLAGAAGAHVRRAGGHEHEHRRGPALLAPLQRAPQGCVGRPREAAPRLDRVGPGGRMRAEQQRRGRARQEGREPDVDGVVLVDQVVGPLGGKPPVEPADSDRVAQPARGPQLAAAHDPVQAQAGRDRAADRDLLSGHVELVAPLGQAAEEVEGHQAVPMRLVIGQKGRGMGDKQPQRAGIGRHRGKAIRPVSGR